MFSAPHRRGSANPYRRGSANPYRRGSAKRLVAVVAGATALVVSISACASGSSSGTSGAAGSSGSSSSNKPLKSLVVATSSAAVTAAAAGYAVGQYLGCYAQQGYKLTVKADANAPGLIAAMQRGEADIGIPGTDQYLGMVQTIKKGGNGLPLKAIYEVAYPFHWGLAVKPGSSITNFSDLVGKTVGIDTLADSSLRILQALLTNDGIDPSKVKTVATGLGAASGQALDSGKVDALFTFDTVFATILQSGIKVQFVLDNSGKQPFLPVTGVVAVMPDKVATADPGKAKAFATCTTEGSLFAKTNPAAAAYILIKMFPSLGSPGKPLDQQIATVAFQIAFRARTIQSSDPSVVPGAMSALEFQDTLKYLLNQAPDSMGDVTQYFTNANTAALTAAETAAVTKQAQDFKIPGVSSPITLPTLPPNAP
jgi:NitT/TauT family transport system substrate-binding protein